MTALSPIAETEEQLLDLVAHHIGTVTGMMTPECARWLLKLNTGNRPLSKNGLERFRNIARAGEWKLTGEPFVVASNAVLNDGQHRLAAIRDTGVTVPADVRFGALREAFECTGTGKRRTAAQALAVVGTTYVAMAGSIARLVALHDLGKLHDMSFRIENAELVTIVQADSNIIAISRAVHAAGYRPSKSAAFAFPLVLAARSVPVDLTTRFITLVATGLTETPHDAARTLHVALMDAQLRKLRLKQIEVATLTARAWNAWIAGREIKQLKVKPDDKSGKNFPQVVGVPV